MYKIVKAVNQIKSYSAYVTPSLSLTGNGGMVYEKIVEIDDDFIKVGADFGVNITGAMEFGAKVSILPGVNTVEVEVKGYGKAEAYGEGVYESRSNANDLFKLSVGLNPLIAGFSGEVKLENEYIDFTLLDVKKEWSLTEKMEASKIIVFDE